MVADKFRPLSHHMVQTLLRRHPQRTRRLRTPVIGRHGADQVRFVQAKPNFGNTIRKTGIERAGGRVFKKLRYRNDYALQTIA